MQNRGLIRLFAILFGLVSLYQLSFSFFTSKVENEAKEYAKSRGNLDNGRELASLEKKYLDSVNNLEVINIDDNTTEEVVTEEVVVDTTTTSTTTTLPEGVVTYLEEIQSEKIQSIELGKKVLETNQRWDDKDTTYQEAQQEFEAFIDDAGSIYAAVMNQGTVKYYQPNNTDAGKLVYKTNPQIKTAWNTTVKALDSGIGARLGQFTSDWNIGMNKGAMATILAPAWMLDYIKKQAPDTKGKWDIADLPVGGGNQGGTQLGVTSYSKNKQAAYDFLTWYLAPEQQLKVFKTYGLFPSTSVLYDDAALLDYKDEFFSNAPVGQIYTKGVLKLKPIFEGELQRKIDSTFGAGLGRVASKKMTSEKSYALVISDIDKLFKN